MDKEFKSSVGWWYHLILILITIGCIAAILQPNIWIIIAMLLAAMLALHVFLNTWYRITPDGILIAHCSIFPEKKIAVADIEALEPTMMPASSYALSLDRLMIWSDGKPWLLVSPKDKSRFVKALKEVNPDIVVMKESSII